MLTEMTEQVFPFWHTARPFSLLDRDPAPCFGRAGRKEVPRAGLCSAIKVILDKFQRITKQVYPWLIFQRAHLNLQCIPGTHEAVVSCLIQSSLNGSQTAIPLRDRCLVATRVFTFGNFREFFYGGIKEENHLTLKTGSSLGLRECAHQPMLADADSFLGT